MLYMSWFLLYNYNKRCILKHYYLNKSICLGFCSIGGNVSPLVRIQIKSNNFPKGKRVT